MRVLVSGYYGFGNAGDEALLEGLLGGLRAAGHRPLVLSADPPATRELHGVAATDRLLGLPGALLRCEALVSGGGGLLQDATSWRSLRFYLSIVRIARLLGRRVAVYGQSIGPLSPAGRRQLTRALRGVPIAVRDRASLELLAELGLPAVLTADTALLLETPALAGSTTSDVVLIPRGGQPRLNDELYAVARHLSDRGRAIELLALHPAEDNDEVRRLAARIAEARIVEADDHRQALRLVAGARLVVSVRLHGLIMAAASGTPFIGLSYDPKVAAFLSDSGGAGFSEPVDRARLLVAAEQAQALTAQARKLLREQAAEGLVWLDRTLRAER